MRLSAVWWRCRLWGDVVGWGTTNLLNSAGECCQQCLKFKPRGPEDGDCNGAQNSSSNPQVVELHARTHNTSMHTQQISPRCYLCAVWVYCGDKQACGSQYKQCWLKHLVSCAREEPTHCVMRHVPLQHGLAACPGLSWCSMCQCSTGPCRTSPCMLRPTAPPAEYTPGPTGCLVHTSPLPSYLPALQPHPEASKPAKQGPQVPWTSGTVGVDLNADPAASSATVRRGSRSTPPAAGLEPTSCFRPGARHLACLQPVGCQADGAGPNRRCLL
jgi:hypothetical protein